jgi:hypothetical protein
MNIKLTPENAAALIPYAKILGCSESEFLNRYLEIHLDNPEKFPLWKAVDTAEVFAEFTFKSREEAQRVLDWYWAASKAEAQKKGRKVRIRTEIVEMDPSQSTSESLEDIGLEAVFMIRAATCYVDVEEEKQEVIIMANPDVREPVEPWSL